MRQDQDHEAQLREVDVGEDAVVLQRVHDAGDEEQQDDRGDQPRLGPLAATVQAPGRVEHEDVRGQHERAHHVVDGVGRGRDHDGHVSPRHVGRGDAADDPVQHAVGQQQVQEDERAEAGAERQQPAHGPHAGVEGHHPHGRRRPGQLRREEHVLHHLEVRLCARRRVHDDDRQRAGRDGERLDGEGDADGAARAAPQAHEAVGEGGVEADPRRHGHEDDWDVHGHLYSTCRSLYPQALQDVCRARCGSDIEIPFPGVATMQR